jgi:hypothetical protein
MIGISPSSSTPPPHSRASAAAAAAAITQCRSKSNSCPSENDGCLDKWLFHKNCVPSRFDESPSSLFVTANCLHVNATLVPRYILAVGQHLCPSLYKVHICHLALQTQICARVKMTALLGWTVTWHVFFPSLRCRTLCPAFVSRPPTISASALPKARFSCVFPPFFLSYTFCLITV